MRTKKEDVDDYLRDAGNIDGGFAEMVYFPETIEDVSEILKKANAAGTHVTVSGARTGTVGGAMPFGGWVMSLERLNSVLEVDPDRYLLSAECGATLRDVQKAADAAGLFYPPDPTEWSCQIGGTVATNASGARGFKYGSTRHYVDRLKIVLPDGGRLNLKRGQTISDEGRLRIETEVGKGIEVETPTYSGPDVRKNTAGYFTDEPLDAIDLFVGSEGTLGVICEVGLRLLNKPDGVFSGIVFFSGVDELFRFVDEARRRAFIARSKGRARSGSAPGGINPTLLEYFDDRSLEFICRDVEGIPGNAAGAVFFEQETTEVNEEALFKAWNSLLEENGAALDSSWFSVTETDIEKMREFRHALPVAVNERVVRNGQQKIGTDMAVPDGRFEDFLSYSRNLLERSGLEYLAFGHIGDCHIHINVLPKDDEEAGMAVRIYRRLVAYAVICGGTVSAEHGIGKLKSGYLDVMYGERYLNEMAEIKKAFDPNLILGIGNMIDRKYFFGGA